MEALCCCAVHLQVKASHTYTADDADELSFEAGEIISVIPFDDPDEQVRNLWLLTCSIYVNLMSK